MPELHLERMTSYYPGTGDVTRSKPTSTREASPPYCLLEKCIGSLSAQTSNPVELVAPTIKSRFQLDSGLLTPPLLESKH